MSLLEWTLGARSVVSVETSFDRSPSQKLLRRWRFYARYLTAQVRSRQIQRFLPILVEAFNHPWVAEVELKIRVRPGNETTAGRLWRMYKSLPAQSMHWDAPITVTVFRERRGKKRQALCMSFYITRGALYIAQIQGIWKTDVPKELRAWPKILLKRAEPLHDGKICARSWCQRRRHSIRIAIPSSGQICCPWLARTL